jgi:hypothetical protein
MAHIQLVLSSYSCKDSLKVVAVWPKMNDRCVVCYVMMYSQVQHLFSIEQWENDCILWTWKDCGGISFGLFQDNILVFIQMQVMCTAS